MTVEPFKRSSGSLRRRVLCGVVALSACSAPDRDGTGDTLPAGNAGMSGAGGTAGRGGEPGGMGGAGAGGAAFPLRPPARRRIAAFGDTTCALSKGSEVVCWGADGWSNLQEVGPYTAMRGDFLTLAVGSDFRSRATVCGVLASGGVRCADWTGDAERVKDLVANIPEGNFIDVAATGEEIAVLDTAGRITGVGNTSSWSAGPPGGRRAVRVTLAGSDVCAIGDEGEALCWYTSDFDTLLPAPVDEFIDIATGDGGTCALTVAGKVRCWNYQGIEWANGFAGETARYRIVQIASSHTSVHDKVCALTDQGRAICGDFALADDRNLPPGEALVELAVGDRHACGIRPDDTVLCWRCSADETECSLITTPPAGFKAAPR